MLVLLSVFLFFFKLTTAFCVSFQTHHSVKMCFPAFLRYPGGFHPALCPIPFPLGRGVWLHLSTTTCYLSHCGTHTHTHLNVVHEACDICSLSGRLHMSSTSSTSLLSISEGGGGAIWQGDKKKRDERSLFFFSLCVHAGAQVVLWGGQQHGGHKAVIHDISQVRSGKLSPCLTLTCSVVLFDSIGPCWHQLCWHTGPDAQKVGYEEVEKSEAAVK